MNIATEILAESDLFCKKRWYLRDEDGAEMTHATGIFRKVALRGQWIDAVLIAGIVTEPHCRRQGGLRTVQDLILQDAIQRGCPIALLHPFSFACYRQFGFERVSDTIICDFPITALQHVSRFPGLKPYADKYLPELLDVYERFALQRNLSMQRNAVTHFLNGENRKIYLDFCDGHCDGYVVIEEQYHFDGVNHNASDNLHVWELVFDNAAALKRLMGFLRVYEGQLDTVCMHDIGMTPEFDWNMSEYMSMKYTIRPDVMAKVINTEKLFNVMVYPEGEGEFTLKVDDDSPMTAGIWQVKYEGGRGKCQRLQENSDFDLEITSSALSRLVFGADYYTAENIGLLPGVIDVRSNIAAILTIFSKCRNGLYEHF